MTSATRSRIRLRQQGSTKRDLDANPTRPAAIPTASTPTAKWPLILFNYFPAQVVSVRLSLPTWAARWATVGPGLDMADRMT